MLGGSVPGAFPHISSVPSENKIQQYAVKEITSYVNIGSLDPDSLVTVSVEKGPGNALGTGFIERGDTIKVTARLPFHIIPGKLLGNLNDFVMTRSASMRFE